MEIIIPVLGFKPLIGVIHLPPLPGSHQGFSGIERLVDYALREAEKLERAGFDAVILENYSDNPFPNERVNDVALTAMSVIVREVVKNSNLRVGISLLRNAGLQALAIAYSSSAHFIRVNAYCETRVAPEGILHPIASRLEAIRQQMDRHILVLADVDVKHSGPLGTRNLEEVIHDCVSRGRMDAIIVSGHATSQAPSPGYVAAIKKLAGFKPVLIGSGIGINNVRAYWNIADGFIVGTSIKIGNDTRKPIDPAKAKKLAETVKELRRSSLQRFEEQQ